MRSLAFVAAFAIAIAPACRSTAVSPASIRASEIPARERDEVLERWSKAVARANEFLASPYRHTLPLGRFELSDEGMRFESEAGSWPIRVRCTSFGGVCLWFGFIAQERSDGFIVGSCPPERDAAVDNSMFRTDRGFPLFADSVCDLILHETTHVVAHDGTVSFWSGVEYYLEAIFLFRYSNHSAERRPRATNEEFHAFISNYERAPEIQQAAIDALAEHAAGGPRSGCNHKIDLPALPTAAAP